MAPLIPAGELNAYPFLKWAGGKSRILGELMKRIPDGFRRYHEPFLGSGALFFCLAREGLLKRGACLSDLNQSLIDTFLAVQKDVNGVVSALRFRRIPGLRNRFIGNTLIAIGAILPGIGGAMSRAGYTEVLYVAEFIGILLIFAGYRRCAKDSPSDKLATDDRIESAASSISSG